MLDFGSRMHFCQMLYLTAIAMFCSTPRVKKFSRDVKCQRFATPRFLATPTVPTELRKQSLSGTITYWELTKTPTCSKGVCDLLAVKEFLFQRTWKICSWNWIISLGLGANKKYWKPPANLLPSLKLTARPWKWMVGRWISFWGPAQFQGRTVSFREGTNP